MQVHLEQVESKLKVGMNLVIKSAGGGQGEYQIGRVVKGPYTNLNGPKKCDTFWAGNGARLVDCQIYTPKNTRGTGRREGAHRREGLFAAYTSRGVRQIVL
jgi:hypothetical protein